jgi:glycosyltransferase involved in cell wall biosynthesis
MPRFSLVIATLGRTSELERLFVSILNQQRTDIEVIVVDQNDDSRVAPILQEVPDSIKVTHIREREKNVSRARNVGMDNASGEIIAFPDDDCWYPNGLLDQIDAWFRFHPEYGVFSTGAFDESGQSSGNRWIQNSCEIAPLNALRTTFCCSLFISAVEASRQTRFDEALNRGEETDFVLRLLARGLRGRFEKKLYVFHPRRDMLSGTVSRDRARSYGAGMGRLARRHSLFLLWIGLLSYDLARTGLVLLRGQIADSGFCLAHAQGLFSGFVNERSN